MNPAKAYIDYRLRAKNRHGVHSPFVFELIEKVFRGKEFFAKEQIKKLRSELKHSRREIDIADYGAGSRVNEGSRRTIGQIAKVSSTPLRDAAMLQRLATHLNCLSVLELGTNLGLTTAALAASPAVKEVVSLEGDPTLATLARQNISQLNLDASITTGRFEDTLDTAIAQLGKIDLAYIDGNHRHKPTLEYFNKIAAHTDENSVIVVGDIHWSDEMEAAWEEIKLLPGVRVTIDIFTMGLFFFRKEMTPQHFTIKY